MKKIIPILGALCLMSVAMTASAEFNWRSQEGKTLKIVLSKHPYSDALTQSISKFEDKTGINVEVAVIPEENYFDKITTMLNSRSGDPDVFMTGAYQVWSYAPGGFIQSLDEFIQDEDKTSRDYDFADFFDGPIKSLRWDLKPGHPVGDGSLWALPIGFEANFLSYNKKLLSEKNLNVPKTMKELYAVCTQLQGFDGPGSYALATRGTRNWATIHPGYMSTYSNYGAKDFAIEDGKLVSKVNSPESIKMNKEWVKMVQECGSPTWSNYTWYQASADLGAGKAAILYDASAVGFFQNAKGNSKEAGNLAYAPPPLPEGATETKVNLWTWAISMNQFSKSKDAAWLFIQYFTSKDYLLWATTQASVPTIDTPRKSVFYADEYTKILSDYEGYQDALAQTIPGTIVQFVPQPYFFETTTLWAATLQNMVQGADVEKSLNALKKQMDEIVEDIEI